MPNLKNRKFIKILVVTSIVTLTLGLGVLIQSQNSKKLENYQPKDTTCKDCKTQKETEKTDFSENLQNIKLVGSKFNNLKELKDLIGKDESLVSFYGYKVEYREISNEKVETIKENIQPLPNSEVYIDDCLIMKFNDSRVSQISTGISLQGGGTDLCFEKDFKLTKQKRLEFFGESQQLNFQRFTGVFTFSYPSNGFTIEKTAEGYITKVWLYQPISLEEYKSIKIEDVLNPSLIQVPFGWENNPEQFPENVEEM